MTRVPCVAAAWPMVAAAAGLLPSPASAQQDRVPAGDSAAPSFYDGRDAVPLTLTANFGLLRRDRQADPPWRAATVLVQDSAGRDVVVPSRVRTRGIWRRNNCRMPPLRLDVPRSAVAMTLLSGVNRPKLVHFCEDRPRGEQYVLQELQLYRVYALLAPISHKARVVRVTYVDSGTADVRTTRYGFLLEEPQALARRVGAEELEITGLVSEDLDARMRVIMGVFQYMIGNTDWSTAGLHNVELFARDGRIYPVPYDFDYSGAVNAHYAVPPPQVRIRNVRQRIYRGACAGEATFEEVFALFRTNRDAIRALYADEVGQLLESDVVRRTLEYFDEFYEVLDDPRAVRREIYERCAGSQ